jgi:hypothetical protein
LRGRVRLRRQLRIPAEPPRLGGDRLLETGAIMLDDAIAQMSGQKTPPSSVRVLT